MSLCSFSPWTVPAKMTLFRFNSFASDFEPGPIGTVSRDHEGSVRQSHHRAQEIVDSFFRREPAKVEQVPFIEE